MAKQIHLYLARYQYNTEGDRNTIGHLYLDKEDDKPFCFTLEDEIRPKDVKVYGSYRAPYVKIKDVQVIGSAL